MKVIALILTVVLSINAEATPLLETKDNDRPNILLVMLDDVGFMGLGVYGSDAATPNIDKIAQQGMQFSRYYTAPMCGPSRAMLMTGQDSHQVGMATLVESLTPEMEQHPSYSMEWQDNQKTLASRLKKSGYQTFVSGKWGIGRNGKNLPHRFGFDRSFVLDATGASNYQEKPYMALYKTVKWFEDGKRVSLPEDFYSSRDLVDKMITYVDEADTNKPFFAYLSLQAIHIPVQVPLEYIDKYNGVFDQGWDEMRKQRLQKAIHLGLVPSSTTLANVPESHRNWDELSAADKTYWARMMQVNAGMTEAADYHIGRLLKYLEKQGKLDNTLVVITSDNGSEYNTIGQGANSVIENIGTKLWMQSLNWDTDLDNLGQRNSLAAIGPEWASVTSAPFNLYKFNSSEGGQRVPLVMSGPGIRNLGLVSGRAHITDIVPTLLEQAAVPFNPDEFYGRSLTPMLNAQIDDVWGDDSFAFETSGNASVYRGNWKIALIKQPLGDETWHIYDVVNDPGETTDLATKFPVLFQEMLNEYQAYSKMVGIIELGKGENAINQIRANAIKERVTDNWPKVLILLVVIGLIVFGIKKAKQKH